MHSPESSGAGRGGARASIQRTTFLGSPKVASCPRPSAAPAPIKALIDYYQKVQKMTKASIELAIIGAGPYGLAAAAYLQPAGVEFQVFGEPMASWRRQIQGIR